MTVGANINSTGLPIITCNDDHIFANHASKRTQPLMQQQVDQLIKNDEMWPSVCVCVCCSISQSDSMHEPNGIRNRDREITGGLSLSHSFGLCRALNKLSYSQTHADDNRFPGGPFGIFRQCIVLAVDSIQFAWASNGFALPVAWPPSGACSLAEARACNSTRLAALTRRGSPQLAVL